MAVQTVYNTCGPVIVNTDWTTPFLNAIALEERGRGSKFSYSEVQGRWLLYNTGSAGSAARRLNYRVGTPLENINTGEVYYDTLSNASTVVLQLPTGAKVLNVQIEQSNSEPIPSGYIHNADTDTLTLPMGVQDANVYIEVA